MKLKLKQTSEIYKTKRVYLVDFKLIKDHYTFEFVRSLAQTNCNIKESWNSSGSQMILDESPYRVYQIGNDLIINSYDFCRWNKQCLYLMPDNKLAKVIIFKTPEVRPFCP